MAVRVLLVLTALAVLYGCSQASSPAEKRERQGSVEEAGGGQQTVSSPAEKQEATQGGVEKTQPKTAGIADQQPLKGIDVQRIKPEVDRNGKIVFQFDGQIWSMNADGSNRIQLTHNARSYAAPLEPSWSPDGEKIAFSGYRDGYPQERLACEKSGSSSASASGSAAGRASPEHLPCIYVMNADGSELTRLTGPSAYSPSWAPDGRKIAFARDVESGSGEIYVTNADGSGKPERMTECCYSFPTWSPDGEWMAFTGGPVARSDDLDIYAMNLSHAQRDTNPQRLTGTSNRGELDPSWSPDGTEIAFSSIHRNVPYDRASDQLDIHKIDLNTLTETNLTNSPEVSEYSSAWAPDSEAIAFLTSEGVYKINADGSNPTLIRKYIKPLVVYAIPSLDWG